MLVRVETAGPAVLEEQENLKALKVVAGADVTAERVLAALGATAADEDDHVWIPAATFRALARPVAGWEKAFAAMLAKVEQFGWYDAERDTVKAHVERAD